MSGRSDVRRADQMSGVRIGCQAGGSDVRHAVCRDILMTRDKSSGIRDKCIAYPVAKQK